MSNNIENYINEINRLMKYDRSKTLLEQESIFTQQMFNPNYGIFSNPESASGYTENLDDDINSLASFLCGDDSPVAGWFTIPWIEYPSEELLCDLAAPILAMFGPPGVAAGLTIEFLHAKDLWNKGDKLGAVLSMTIGLLPVIGDVSAKGIRALIKKVGNSGFVKVVGVLARTVKFLSGNLPASQVWESFSKLTKNERELFNIIIETSDEVLDRTQKLIPEIESLKNKLSNIPGISNITDEALDNVISVLKNSSVWKTLANVSAQFTSIMSLIFTAEFINHIGFSEDEEITDENIQIINEFINDPNIEEFLESGSQIFRNNE